ncbi:MAG: TlpA disulfide reductase family protein [Armatimonadota bacterium]
MRTKLFAFLTVLAVLITTSLASNNSDIGPGSPAPKLEIKTWVKGEPIKAFNPNKTYVVEFWATWCGPCIESIPHLTELAKKFDKTRFIGVSILEDNQDKRVQDFVAKMGAKMEYSVAYAGNKTGMAKSWMDSAKQNGIPFAFIIKNNTIMWIGHPDYLEKPLTEVLAGTFDVRAAREKFDKVVARQEAARVRDAEMEAIEKLFDSGKRSEAKARLARLESHPEGKDVGSELRFKWLAIEDIATWKAQCLTKMNASEDNRSSLSSFAKNNCHLAPEPCKWLIDELTSGKFPPNWYPHINGGRMYLLLKDYEKALAHCAKAKQIIIDYQAANPDLPKGNALEVIQALVDQIEKGKKG